ncbi:hypothetical protein [Rhodonellum sp.]|uniref:hypothetical protein n=1 Tax=Rhodonellum sp. TaxID=2231180 RepID=UPI00272447DB|nr:hypothetical protein [Rhodonellum sp.]MDO9554526.1 hypothetical protein [Rhodonellum sp.]
MNTELHAANAILERGVRAKVRAPFFCRWIGIKNINLTLKKLYAGTLFRISAYYVQTGITEEQLKEVTAHEAILLMATHGVTISKAVACGIINSQFRGWMFTRLLAWYIRENMPNSKILMLYEICLLHNGTSDFMTITRYVRMLKITDPTGLGQKAKKGS